jgi:hypothetical protein
MSSPSEKRKFGDVLKDFQNKRDFVYDDILHIMNLGYLHHRVVQIKKPSSKRPSTPVQQELLRSSKVEVISVKMESFSDLVHFVNTFPYREDTTYNIDIASLFRIRNEIIQLDHMVGITQFKNSVLNQILYFVQRLHCDGKDPDFMHTVLCGPPGTGKTEIAKLLGHMYAKLGILKNGTFKKVTRSDLVAGYLGQTAIKTNKVIQDCLGGCLFIDEAYALAGSASDNNDSYSKECLDTLCEALSDHKGELMVILAGYEEELDNTIFRVNQGLDSRFIWRFTLDKYSASDLQEIFLRKVVANGWACAEEKNQLASWFERRYTDFPHYGRDMERLFLYSKIVHGRRIYGHPELVRKELHTKDLDNGYQLFLENRKAKTTRREIPMGLYV